MLNEALRARKPVFLTYSGQTLVGIKALHLFKTPSLPFKSTGGAGPLAVHATAPGLPHTLSGNIQGLKKKTLLRTSVSYINCINISTTSCFELSKRLGGWPSKLMQLTALQDSRVPERSEQNHPRRC